MSGLPVSTPLLVPVLDIVPRLEPRDRPEVILCFLPLQALNQLVLVFPRYGKLHVSTTCVRFHMWRQLQRL